MRLWRHNITLDHPLRRFFSATIENSFYSQMGVCAPDLVDYLANLLLDFVHIRDIYALKSVNGEPLTEVADMITRAYYGPDLSESRRQMLIHRHVGDYTLYWTGLYPEQLQRVHLKNIRDLFIDYCEQGKLSYGIVSELAEPDDEPPPAVFLNLSDHFEECVQGLHIARKGWDDPGELGTDPLASEES